jgi:hypothetical protein
MRFHHRRRALPLLVVAAAIASTAASCPKTPAVLVGQSGLAVAQSIGQLQSAVKQLTDQKALPPPVALAVQEKLLELNGHVAKLPELLRTIDTLTQASQNAAGPIDQAVAILTVVSQDLSVTIAGVPLAPTTEVLIKLIRAAQQTVTTTLLEVAKLRGDTQ